MTWFDRLWAFCRFHLMRHEGTAPEILAAFEEVVAEQEEQARVALVQARHRVMTGRGARP